MIYRSWCLIDWFICV